MPKTRYVMSIDQGTTSSRAIIFDHGARLVSVGQVEHRQYYPRPGWVEHDAAEIWHNVQASIAHALQQIAAEPSDIAAVGIANQRETAVVWERTTGKPVRRAIGWQDTRTDPLVTRLSRRPGAGRVPELSGIPLGSYVSAPKLRWMLEHTRGLRERADAGELLFGTMETWLIWNLTGGPDGGTHITDVTNASRTQLMNIRTLHWDDELLDFFEIPQALLPEIRPSMQVYGRAGAVLDGVPIAGALGDQQAALFGQTCFAAGDTKCTFGTGSFLLQNTGPQIVDATHGILPTVAYQASGEPAAYALEGAVAITGSLVQWFRDGLGLITTAPEIETLARTVEDNAGCYIVPAFYGLFAPYWRREARGVIAGLTSYVTKGHLARAVLEATAWQTREVIDAMKAATGLDVQELKVDGGMTSDNLLMQYVADFLGVPVVRPMVAETVSLGAAYAAGLTIGFWPDLDRLSDNWHRAAEWVPDMDPQRRAEEYSNWQRAVELTFGWAAEA